MSSQYPPCIYCILEDIASPGILKLHGLHKFHIVGFNVDLIVCAQTQCINSTHFKWQSIGRFIEVDFSFTKACQSNISTLASFNLSTKRCKSPEQMPPV